MNSSLTDDNPRETHYNAPMTTRSLNNFPVTLQFIVEPYLSGVRVDSFLIKHLRNYTSWRLHRMVAAGLTRIDDLPADPIDRVVSGQTVSIRLVEPPDKLLEPEDVRLTVVYEDPWLMVVDKPAGLIAHPVGDFQDGTLSNALQCHLDQQTPLKGLLRPGVVHRLDRMTSGLIVVAKEHLAHRLLSIDFQQGKLSKSYKALIEGSPPFESTLIELAIGQRPGGHSILMSARPDARNPRPAKTRVTVLERLGKFTLVECALFTGRNHQIRVHLSHIGFPVAGDEFYGPNGSIRRTPSGTIADDDLDVEEQRHALHAASLGFFHPILREWMQFQTSPPADFWSLMHDQTK